MEGVALWPLLLYFALVLVVVASMIGISYVLGQRHKDVHTGLPYESGIAGTGSAHLRFDVKFYLTGMFFVIFDLEAAFLVAWAVAVREVGWAAYVGVLFFVGVLLAGLVYEWRLGALDWVARPRTRR